MTSNFCANLQRGMRSLENITLQNGAALVLCGAAGFALLGPSGAALAVPAVANLSKSLFTRWATDRGYISSREGFTATEIAFSVGAIAASAAVSPMTAALTGAATVAETFFAQSRTSDLYFFPIDGQYYTSSKIAWTQYSEQKPFLFLSDEASGKWYYYGNEYPDENACIEAATKETPHMHHGSVKYGTHYFDTFQEAFKNFSIHNTGVQRFGDFYYAEGKQFRSEELKDPVESHELGVPERDSVDWIYRDTNFQGRFDRAWSAFSKDHPNEVHQVHNTFFLNGQAYATRVDAEHALYGPKLEDGRWIYQGSSKEAWERYTRDFPNASYNDGAFWWRNGECFATLDQSNQSMLWFNPEDPCGWSKVHAKKIPVRFGHKWYRNGEEFDKEPEPLPKKSVTWKEGIKQIERLGPYTPPRQANT